MTPDGTPLQRSGNQPRWGIMPLGIIAKAAVAAGTVLPIGHMPAGMAPWRHHSSTPTHRHWHSSSGNCVVSHRHRAALAQLSDRCPTLGDGVRCPA
eukprot:gene10777-biopygen4253